MLTLRTLPLRNAAYFRRGNLPVLLGVAVGAAVLTGALLVGDSLRGSLKEKADRQLAGVTGAWVGPRFIWANVVDQIGPDAYPAIILQGTIETVPKAGDLPKRIANVSLFGVPDQALSLNQTAFSGWNGFFQTIAVNPHLGARLGVGEEDVIRVGVEKFSAVPRSSLLGRRGNDESVDSITVKLFYLPGNFTSNDFSLVPTPSVPSNAFLRLRFLQSRLGVPGKCNAVLYTGPDVAAANAAFAKALDLPDWGIRVLVPPKRAAYVSIESDSLVLDGPTVAAVERACAKLGLRHERTFVYLANEIAAGKESIPYSIVCATNVAAAEPLGPLLPPGVEALADDEIVLADWAESPLKGKKSGDPVTITYFKPELEGGEETATATFKLKGFVPLSDAAARPTPRVPLPADDPDLTPPFPGITDKLKIGDWNPPFPFDNRKIQRRDEKFWDEHKTTPKAYITTAAGEKLFGSRFGTVTSIRVAPAAGQSPEQTAEKLKTAIRAELDPAAAGFVLEDTRARLAAASKGGTDFGGLFLGFSFFLIGAALLLVALLFRLNVERRAQQVGLLLSAGYPPRMVRRLLLVEGLIIAGLGALLGVLLAVGFARGMLAILVALWPDPEAVTFLRVHVDPLTLLIGFAATVLMAILAIWFSLRGLAKVPAPALLRGETRLPRLASDAQPGPRAWVWPAVCALAGIALLFVGPTQTNPDIRAGTFFSGGGLLLVAGLWAVRIALKRIAHGTAPSRSILGLALRNAARNPGRSLLTVSLLAAATFLLVAVESFRRSPDKDFAAKNGGSGGFALVGESAVPVFRPLDSAAGRDDLEQALEKAYQDLPGDEPASKRAKADLAALDGTTIVPLRLRGGDDASCLNLYQAGKPRILGVPDSLIDRGGFRFGDTLAETAEEKTNPWLLLKKPQPGGAVPFVVEQNSAMWMLKIGVGDTIDQPDEAGNSVKFRLVGTLVDCPLQSELFIADESFRKLYPRQEGFRVFLIDTPSGKQEKVAAVFEAGLRANGLSITPTKDKVAGFQAVVGTYLTLFQLLGGFGLVLGVLGLAVVLVRGVAERAGELALLRAVGFSTVSLRNLVLAETLVLLVLGLGIGLVAAVISVAPQSAAEAGFPALRLAVVLGAVAATGVLAAALATRASLRVPLVPALRAE
jgi:ABC-type antimicrobial peptide transport system permease subunit